MPKALMPQSKRQPLDRVPYSVTYWPPDDMTADPVETPITRAEYQLLTGQRAEPASEIPDWVTSTPEPVDTYDLGYYRGGDGIEYIDLTRAEFIALKRHLAVMRGHIPAIDAYPHVPTDAASLFERGRKLVKES